jgi:hypothetical protein
MAACIEQFPGDFDSDVLSARLVGHNQPAAVLAFLGVMDFFSCRFEVPWAGPFAVAAFETDAIRDRAIAEIRAFMAEVVVVTAMHPCLR